MYHKTPPTSAETTNVITKYNMCHFSSDISLASTGLLIASFWWCIRARALALYAPNFQPKSRVCNCESFSTFSANILAPASLNSFQSNRRTCNWVRCRSLIALASRFTPASPILLWERSRVWKWSIVFRASTSGTTSSSPILLWDRSRVCKWFMYFRASTKGTTSWSSMVNFDAILSSICIRFRSPSISFTSSVFPPGLSRSNFISWNWACDLSNGAISLKLPFWYKESSNALKFRSCLSPSASARAASSTVLFPKCNVHLDIITWFHLNISTDDK